MIYHSLDNAVASKLLIFGEKVYQETRFNAKPFNRESILEFLILVSNYPNKFFVAYTLDKDEEITSLFLGQISTEYFTGDKIASDLGMFVRKDKRGTSLFYKLVSSFEKWAKAKEATKIILYHSTGIEPEKTKGLYARLGYIEYGSIFDKEI